MFQKEQAPSDLAAKCEEFTKNWLASQRCEAVPYLQPCEIDDEWRIAIWHTPVGQQEKALLCKYLQPTVEGHTLYLLVQACFDAEVRGKEIGRIETLLKLFKQQCDIAGFGKSLKSISVEAVVSGLPVTTSITNK